MSKTISKCWLCDVGVIVVNAMMMCEADCVLWADEKYGERGDVSRIMRPPRRFLCLEPYSRASLVEVTDEGVLELGPDAVHVKTGGDGELQPDPGFDWVEETGRDPVSAGRYGPLVAMVST